MIIPGDYIILFKLIADMYMRNAGTTYVGSGAQSAHPSRKSLFFYSFFYIVRDNRRPRRIRAHFLSVRVCVVSVQQHILYMICALGRWISFLRMTFPV